MFEVASSTLLRDKESVLAKILIDAYPPVRIPIQDENENTPMISPVPNSNSITNAGSISNSSAGPAGLTPIQALPSVTYERDWWLFRYILAFLRDGTLPGDQETSLLIALYKEAAFYNMVELQHAIEDRKLRLRESSSASNGSLNNNNVKKLDDKDELWWKQLPSWFHAVDLVAEAKKEEYKKKSEVIYMKIIRNVYTH